MSSNPGNGNGRVTTQQFYEQLMSTEKTLRSEMRAGQKEILDKLDEVVKTVAVVDERSHRNERISEINKDDIADIQAENKRWVGAMGVVSAAVAGIISWLSGGQR